MVANPSPDDPRDEQRRRILETATQLFAENGFDEVTMAEIAEEAGVARATVFNYFRSKHSLIEAITEGVLDVYRVMLDDALADDETSAPMLLRKLCDDMGKGIEAQRRLYSGVFREIARIQLGFDAGEVAHRANEDVRSRVLRLMERGQARGELSASLPADALADAFHSLINGTITSWLFHDPTRPLTLRMALAADVFLSPIESARSRGSAPKGAKR